MCEQNKELKRHKWADVLIAIAEGREVQWRTIGSKIWTDLEASSALECMNNTGIEWRVKPKIVRKYFYAYQIKGRSPNVSLGMYNNDEEFENCSGIYESSLWFQRLDNSCVEVEES